MIGSLTPSARMRSCISTFRWGAGAWRKITRRVGKALQSNAGRAGNWTRALRGCGALRVRNARVLILWAWGRKVCRTWTLRGAVKQSWRTTCARPAQRIALRCCCNPAVRQSSLLGSPDRRQICSKINRDPRDAPISECNPEWVHGYWTFLGYPSPSAKCPPCRSVPPLIRFTGVSGAPGKKVSRYRVRRVSTTPSPACSMQIRSCCQERPAMLVIAIVAALSFAGVIGYIFYLTPGPKDHIWRSPDPFRTPRRNPFDSGRSAKK